MARLLSEMDPAEGDCERKEQPEKRPNMPASCCWRLGHRQRDRVRVLQLVKLGLGHDGFQVIELNSCTMALALALARGRWLVLGCAGRRDGQGAAVLIPT